MTTVLFVAFLISVVMVMYGYATGAATTIFAGAAIGFAGISFLIAKRGVQ